MESTSTSRNALPVVAMAVLVVLGSVSPAQAHPDVDAGRARYAQADFPGALEAFSRAEAADDLTRAELLDLLERRILIHLVQGDQPSADRDLESIRAIDPDHEFARDVPPEVVEAFRGAEGAPLSVVVESAPRADGVDLTSRVENEPTGLVREVRLHYRVEGGPWEVTTDSSVHVGASGGETLEFHGEAIGPGGAAIATFASADAPREVRIATELTAEEERPDDSGGFPWLWVGVGAAVLVAVVVVVVILAAGGGGDDAANTQPLYPMIEF
jgi:hypothetical protein